ncbi:hypothetical protein [Zoogloea sp. LCSB751]|uniref:hypothetical protein n=1 Tax=Zoogloea sp. LCSB751 TaxID=1965277 RepID=UPI0011167D60|nr:hypothetical protein [Zoogloea sp. LCSB751]
MQGLQLRRQQLTGMTAQNTRQMSSRQDRLQREIAELRMVMKAIQARNEQLEMRLIAGDVPAPPATKSASDDMGSAPAVAHAWAELLQQGEAVRIGWVRSGELVPSSTLAEAWGRTRQALEQALRRGELFSIKVGKNRYYPAVFTKLEAETVKTVCLALKGKDEVGKFIFWSRPHGGLGGETLLEALSSGQSDQVYRLAEGWSAERGQSFRTW